VEPTLSFNPAAERLRLLGLNHRGASIAVRERFAVPSARLREALDSLRAATGAREAVILSTCNRVEIYTWDAVAQADAWLCDWGGREFWRQVSPLRATGREAVVHLFEVAAGLDSMMLGEPQIQMQVRQAADQAEACGACGHDLRGLFRAALRAARKVHAATGIGRLAASVPAAAAETAVRMAPRAQGQRPRIAVIGSGHSGELALQRLTTLDCAPPTRLVSRSRDHAWRVASRTGAEPVAFTDDLEFARDADALLCATSAPYHLITPEHLAALMARRAGRPLLIVDVAVPRNVNPDAASVPGVTLINIDQIDSLVAGDGPTRAERAAVARELVKNFADTTARRFASARANWTQAFTT
jgi:glutamyl-tRNA reductase